MSKPAKFLGQLILRKGDKPPVIGISWWSKTKRVRVRFHGPCLAKGGRKVTDAHGASSAMRMIYKNSLEAQQESCVECGGRLQETLVASGSGGKIEPQLNNKKRIILP